MNIIKYLQMNQISAFDKQSDVDISSNNSN